MRMRSKPEHPFAEISMSLDAFLAIAAAAALSHLSGEGEISLKHLEKALLELPYTHVNRWLLGHGKAKDLLLILQYVLWLPPVPPAYPPAPPPPPKGPFSRIRVGPAVPGDPTLPVTPAFLPTSFEVTDEESTSVQY